VLDDDWTVVTLDGALSAQFEHTVLVTETGCEVLTARPALLTNSEDRSWATLGPRSCPAVVQRQGSQAPDAPDALPTQPSMSR